MRICFATNNAHKLEEVQAILGSNFPLVTLANIGCDEELPETTGTIPGNSQQKAAYVFDHYHIPSLADDSGLEVIALNGEPGVDSAYYAGPQRNHNDNMNLLLSKLRGIADRRASFRTVLTFISAEAEIHQFEGKLKGTVLEEKRGIHGFGYDPLFLPDGSSKTLGEMTPAEKNAISHRAKAVHQLAEFLQSR